jgi:transcriptional regulator
MYRPAAFIVKDREVGSALIADHPLAQLIVVDTAGEPIATPVPLVEDADRLRLVGHLARANPVARQPGPRVALVVFSGADAYVSPNSYPSKHADPRVVPTWNYDTVQLRGTLTVHDDPVWTEWVVRLLTATFEGRTPTPWHVDDAPADYIAKMVGAIVGVEIVIDEITVKRKLSQNRSDADREGVRQRFSAGTPAEQAVASAMRST